jgi:hypothetical protein
VSQLPINQIEMVRVKHKHSDIFTCKPTLEAALQDLTQQLSVYYDRVVVING